MLTNMEYTHTFELQPCFKICVKFYNNVTIGDNSGGRNNQTINKQNNGVKVYFNVDLVPGIFTILTAANKTISCYNSDSDEFKLKTNSIASEFLYNLSPFTSITSALKAFGTDAKTTKVGLIHFQRNGNDSSSYNTNNSLDGTSISIAEVFDFSNDQERYNRIQKYCKLSNEELSLSTIDEAYALHLAMRDVK